MNFKIKRRSKYFTKVKRIIFEKWFSENEHDDSDGQELTKIHKKQPGQKTSPSILSHLAQAIYSDDTEEYAIKNQPKKNFKSKQKKT